MFWITKYRHNKILAQYQEHIDDLKQALYRKEKFEEICEKLADKNTKLTSDLYAATGSCISSVSVMDHLDDTVPRYVPDYFGGRCIKQEAYPVTILDDMGKATYALTATKPDKNKRFILEYKF